MADDVEEWRIVRRHPDYEISSIGRLRRRTPKRGTKVGAFLAGGVNRNGYVVVRLRDAAGAHDYLISRLVCEAFHGEAPDRRPNCLHRNGIRSDNRAGNLYWGSQRENMQDALRHGTVARGERQGCAVLHSAVVAEIRRDRANGRTQQSIADHLGVSRACIADIDQNRTWRHVQ